MSSPPVPKPQNSILSRLDVRCFVAVVAVAAALLLRFVVEHNLGLKLTPFVVLYPTIMVVAIWAGLWPGLVATAVSTLASPYFILEPRGSFSIASVGDAISLALFAVMGVSICWIAERYRISHQYVAAMERELVVRESEKQFLTLANAMPQLAWMAHSDGSLFWYNQRWYEYTGTTPAEMDGWGWQSLHDPTQLPAVLERWRASIQTGAPFDMVFPLRGKDGIFRPFLTRIVPMKNADGEVVRWFGTNTDISEQEKTERALRRQAELLRLSFDAVIVWRLDEGIESWNVGAERMYGFTENDVLGRVTHDLLQTASPKPLPEIRSELKNRGYWEGELQHIARDGRTIIVSTRWQLIQDENGIDRVLEINRDITERKLAEQALREGEQRYRELSQQLEERVRQRTAELEATLFDLAQSERQFVALANFVPQMVWMCTPDGSNIYFNQRWVEYTGLTLEESYGAGWNTPFHPDDKQTAWDAWNHATGTGERYRVESRLRAADGSYRWFLMLGEPLWDDKGNIARWFGTCTDISELKRSEAALRESQRGLEAVNKELESFSYSVSHDLRAPLRTLDGFSQALLATADGLDDKSRHYLERIRAAAQRMRNLIDALLQLSRTTRADLQVQPVDLSQIAELVLSDLRSSEPDRIVEIRIQPKLKASGDPQLLQAALQNLLANAWKFTARRDHAVIEFGRMNHGSTSAFFVRDNGAGFDMQHADRLFGPFQRLHADTEFQGTGIGLATVQRIVRRHQGRIWAEAVPDQGATFYFELDIWKGSTQDQGAQDGQATKAKDDPASRG